MKMKTIRGAVLTGLLWASTPSAAFAHAGHAGDHGWLAGALQPTLSLDHFLAGVFVALVLSAALAGALRQRGERRPRS